MKKTSLCVVPYWPQHKTCMVVLVGLVHVHVKSRSTIKSSRRRLKRCICLVFVEVPPRAQSNTQLVRFVPTGETYRMTQTDQLTCPPSPTHYPDTLSPKRTRLRSSDNFSTRNSLLGGIFRGWWPWWHFLEVLYLMMMMMIMIMIMIMVISIALDK